MGVPPGRRHGGDPQIVDRHLAFPERELVQVASLHGGTPGVEEAHVAHRQVPVGPQRTLGALGRDLSRNPGGRHQADDQELERRRAAPDGAPRSDPHSILSFRWLTTVSSLRRYA